MSRFTWAKEEERFKRRVQADVESAIHGECSERIGPGSKGRRIADRVAESLWAFERHRIERERREARERKAVEG